MTGPVSRIEACGATDLGEGCGTRTLTDAPARDQVWQVIADVRDAAPRVKNDAETDDIIDALVDRGYLRLAGDGDE